MAGVVVQTRPRSGSMPVPSLGQGAGIFSRSVSVPDSPLVQSSCPPRSDPNAEVGTFLQDVLEIPPPLRRSMRISIPTSRYSPY